MATSKVFVFSMLFALLFVRIASRKSCLEPEDAISSLRIELEQLKTKVSILESTIEKSNDELRAKDDDIKQMENIILEKSESIASLQNKVETLQKVSYEQKTRIDKTEQALRVVEEVMVKAELAANFMKSLKSLIVAHCKNFQRPAFDELFPKILVNFSQVQRDGQKCIEMLKTEWIPVMKDHWLTFLSSLSSHFESLTAKTIEAYHMTKNSLLSHTVKIQKAAVPFIQEAHKFAKPYINQIETVTKPYVDMVVVTLEPHSGKPVRAYRMFVTSAISYHKQTQQMLKTNEFTRSLASMELAWFAATALLCLPVIFLCRLYSATFRKKAWKPRRISHSNNVRHRLIRPHNIY